MFRFLLSPVVAVEDMTEAVEVEPVVTVVRFRVNRLVVALALNQPFCLVELTL